jgi:hypothetical protein
MNLKDLVPQRETPDHLDGLVSDNQWDWLMRNRHENGLDEYIYDINGKLYSYPPDIKSRWLESRRESNLKRRS